jgi:hypothetical protein
MTDNAPGTEDDRMDVETESACAASILQPLESAVQLFSYTTAELVGCAYVYFEQSKTPVVVSNGALGPRYNRNPVLPRLVNVDAIEARQMITNLGEEGYSYALFFEGDHVASIEVTSGRVVIVHQTYSPLALEAGLIDPATRLVFERLHPRQLSGLMDDMTLDDDLVYLPTSEIMLGRALERIPVRNCKGSEARRVWIETKAFLRSMQSDVIRGVQRQNSTEFCRVSVKSSEMVSTDLSLLL